MISVGSIVLRVDDLEAQARFWEAAPGYVRRPEASDDFVLLRPPDADYVHLEDPEGNRFCVVDAG